MTGRFDNTDNWHIGDDRMPESDMKNLSYNARGPVKWMIGWHDKYIEAELEKGTSIDETIGTRIFFMIRVILLTF